MYHADIDLNDDNLIDRLKLMSWPAGYGVTSAPRLGGSPGQKAAFMAYISAVNNGAIETFAQFYHPEVVVSIPGLEELKGREGIIGHYKPMFEKVREKLQVNHLIADDEAICADITSTFIAVQDAPDFTVKPLKKGETLTNNILVIYKLKDGLIYRMKIAR
jgi:SnoaL-like domain